MPAAPRHDWYLKAWMRASDATQSDLVELTEIPKATMSELVNGKQRYNRDILNKIADALHIRPYELLMHPDEAHAIRRVRESAVRIAAETPADEAPAEAERSRFG
jgi:transcriptional regulator with XRE-family HTH domain